MNKRTKRTIEDTCWRLLVLARKHDMTATLDSVIAATQECLGKPIRLRSADFGATEVFGLWLELPESHTILFDESASPAHQSYIIQHELGHILLGHRTTAARRFDPGPVEQCRLTLRHDLAEAQEAEAEAFAIHMTRMLQTEPWRSPIATETAMARRIWHTIAEDDLIDHF